MLAGHRERALAGGHYTGCRVVVEDFEDDGGHPGDLLEVVQEQENRRAAKHRPQRLPGAQLGSSYAGQRRDDRVGHKLRGANRGQRHYDRSTVLYRPPAHQLLRQPGLADACRTGEREQPDALAREQPSGGCELLLTPEQGRAGNAG